MNVAACEPQFLNTISPTIFHIQRADEVTGMGAANRLQEIAFAFPRGSHQEVFIEGVYRYATEHQRRWSYVIAPEWNSVSIRQLIGWTGDGVIAALNTASEAQCAATFHLPVVNMSSALAESPVPRSMVDNHAIGTLAAEHLLERGFHNYAFYGMHDVEYSKHRLKGFKDALASVGFGSIDLTLPSTFHLRGSVWLKQQQELTKWLAKLETPCGVFAASDARARQVINSCDQLNLKVPEQIAVIGVDDQQIICEHVHPTISSVARNNILEGYTAASLLDKLMRGKRVPRGDQLIPPLQVTFRESTATFAVADERLREVMVYIRSHIEDPITIGELCAHVDVSRRWLEYSFRDLLGETPFQYMRRQRLEYARRLLTDEPNTKIYRIAQRVGFSSAKQLTKVFNREFGMSPREFRQNTVRE
jgi:LacI family transcriptional regulator